MDDGTIYQEPMEEPAVFIDLPTPEYLAARQALRDSAMQKLVAGEPLSEEEAAVITGG